MTRAAVEARLRRARKALDRRVDLLVDADEAAVRRTAKELRYRAREIVAWYESLLRGRWLRVHQDYLALRNEAVVVCGMKRLDRKDLDRLDGIVGRICGWEREVEACSRPRPASRRKESV